MRETGIRLHSSSFLLVLSGLWLLGVVAWNLGKIRRLLEKLLEVLSQ